MRRILATNSACKVMHFLKILNFSDNYSILRNSKMDLYSRLSHKRCLLFFVFVCLFVFFFDELHFSCQTQITTFKCDNLVKLILITLFLNVYSEYYFRNVICLLRTLYDGHIITFQIDQWLDHTPPNADPYPLSYTIWHLLSQNINTIFWTHNGQVPHANVNFNSTDIYTNLSIGTSSTNKPPHYSYPISSQVRPSKRN